MGQRIFFKNVLGGVKCEVLPDDVSLSLELSRTHTPHQALKSRPLMLGIH